MAQLVVRGIESEVKSRLRRRAQRRGRSMEEEVRDILRDAVKEEGAPRRNLGSEMASLFAKAGLDGDIPELHGSAIKPPAFGK